MEIRRNGTVPSEAASEAHFTGRVRFDYAVAPTAETNLRAVTVTFEPGARTAWHTHPKGQTLIVTSGLGWAQSEGGPKQEIRPGDIVWFPPNVRHWHGASPIQAMTHIAMQEAVDGVAVTWMEHVGDADYGG